MPIRQCHCQRVRRKAARLVVFANAQHRGAPCHGVSPSGCRGGGGRGGFSDGPDAPGAQLCGTAVVRRSVAVNPTLGHL